MAHIFSSGWAWLGAIMLAAVVLNGAVNVIEAFRPRRKIKVSQNGTLRIVEIDNAADDDVSSALEYTQNRKEHT